MLDTGTLIYQQTIGEYEQMLKNVQKKKKIGYIYVESKVREE